jgi:hypothetical protein
MKATAEYLIQTEHGGEVEGVVNWRGANIKFIKKRRLSFTFGICVWSRS